MPSVAPAVKLGMQGSQLLQVQNADAGRFQAGDLAWILTSSALVLLMIPGVGFFYSGLARRKSALSLIWLSMMATAVVSFQVRIECALI